MSDSEMFDFSQKIEQIVQEKNMSMMDAILFYCEETGLEIETVPKLINQSIKAKIEHDARNSNLLKDKSSPPLKFNDTI